MLAEGAGTAQIATATLSAAERALNLAFNDKALVETVWLLMQLPLAARSENFAGALRQVGMEVTDSPGLMDLVSAFSEAVDTKLTNGSRTDLGEMAQMAACETISKVVGEKTDGLFGAKPEHVQAAISELKTVAQFGQFAQQFFSRLITRCLSYFLSRTLANHTGEGRRFTTLAQVASFNQAMERHCHEASKIVEVFSGEWFSKANWENNGISRADAGHFLFGAMWKLVDELKAGARCNAQ